MNKAQLDGLRLYAETLQTGSQDWLVVDLAKGRVYAFGLTRERAEDWREHFYPWASVVTLKEWEGRKRDQ